MPRAWLTYCHSIILLKTKKKNVPDIVPFLYYIVRLNLFLNKIVRLNLEPSQHLNVNFWGFVGMDFSRGRANLLLVFCTNWWLSIFC